MILKEFAKKHHLDAQELLDLLIFEKFPIQTIEDEIDDRLIKYLLEYTNKKSKTQLKNKKNIRETKRTRRKGMLPGKEELEEIYLSIQPYSIVDAMKITKLPASAFINFFIKQKKLYSVNSILSKEEIVQFAQEFKINLIEPETKIITSNVEHTIAKKSYTGSDQTNTVKRPPVVVIVGHVDHGKTTLLDTIRNQHVAKSEKGGITQHVGAYEILWKKHPIAFLDTPGHEAFTSLRARGIAIADIGILVISSEEGIKPQTLESIRMLKELRVQVIVALTKIDRTENRNFDNIFQTLTSHDLVPEQWGGTVPIIQVSALKNIGIDELLETILLISDLTDLQAKENTPAVAYILETKMTKGIGITATILLQEGRLRVGDYFYAEGCWGKINNITSTLGKSEIICLPGHPYTISGFSEFPPVGSSLMQVDLKTAKKKADQFLLEKQTKKQQIHSHKKDKPVYNVIIKADVFSSLQAVEKSIDAFTSTNTFSHPMILSATLGELTENDINFAILSKSVIYLFNTKHPTKKELVDLIEKNAVKVKQFDVIYHLLEDIKKQIDEEKDKKPVLKKIGDLLIIKLFHIKGIGTIVGFRVKEGIAKIGAHARLLRQKVLIGEGAIKSLQKEKISVKELSKGNEGAIFINGITDFKEGDTVEVSE